REAHVRLEEAERELRRVLASIPDCLWSAQVDASGRWAYCYFSPVVERLTGRPPEAFLGEPGRWREVVHPEDRRRWEEALTRLRAGRSGQEEYRVVRPGG